MFSLIMVVISIALVAATAVASINYIPAGVMVQQEVRGQVEEGFRALEQGWHEYRRDNQTHRWECEVFTTEENTYEHCERVLDDPGHLPAEDWRDALMPEYLFAPATPGETDWGYDKGEEGAYFCLEGEVTATQLRGIQSAARSFSEQAFFVGDTCGIKENLQLDGSEPGTVRVTYWMYSSG